MSLGGTADTLMIIVPRDGELVVKARLLNRDMGFVHAGQKAEVRLEAFPFTRYGVRKRGTRTVFAERVPL